MIENGLLLEYADYLGNYYGTPLLWVQDRLDQGVNVILEIDIQGGFQVREKIPHTLTVFIMPPSEEELLRRLRNRGTETQEQIKNRMERAKEEMNSASLYDNIIVNEDVEKSAEMLHNIVHLKKGY